MPTKNHTSSSTSSCWLGYVGEPLFDNYEGKIPAEHLSYAPYDLDLYTSRIGGYPEWFEANCPADGVAIGETRTTAAGASKTPNKNWSQCLNCGDPLTFVCQLYCPIETTTNLQAGRTAPAAETTDGSGKNAAETTGSCSPSDSDHRLLHLFCCTNKAQCGSLGSKGWRVFRSKVKAEPRGGGQDFGFTTAGSCSSATGEDEEVERPLELEPSKIMEPGGLEPPGKATDAITNTEHHAFSHTSAEDSSTREDIFAEKAIVEEVVEDDDDWGLCDEDQFQSETAAVSLFNRTPEQDYTTLFSSNHPVQLLSSGIHEPPPSTTFGNQHYDEPAPASICLPQFTYINVSTDAPADRAAQAQQPWPCFHLPFAQEPGKWNASSKLFEKEMQHAEHLLEKYVQENSKLAMQKKQLHGAPTTMSKMNDSPGASTAATTTNSAASPGTTAGTVGTAGTCPSLDDDDAIDPEVRKAFEETKRRRNARQKNYKAANACSSDDNSTDEENKDSETDHGGSSRHAKHNDSDGDDEEATVEQTAFNLFQKRLNRSPEQILRYDFNARKFLQLTPVVYSKTNNKATASKNYSGRTNCKSDSRSKSSSKGNCKINPLLQQVVPQRCKFCNAEKVYEFSLLPSFLYQMVLNCPKYVRKKLEKNENVLEFGAVHVFTCGKNCDKALESVVEESVVLELAI
ncbi:unnamed protein product [Amoebophrya sp. A120]|nr:unnamed protein product [Amoebophrya sp. A120]|eukprot:GSA120T00007316001.1